MQYWRLPFSWHTLLACNTVLAAVQKSSSRVQQAHNC